MPKTLTTAEVKRYLMNDNCARLVEVHRQYVMATADRLAEQYPGILFLWNEGNGQEFYWICALQPNGRGLTALAEDEIAVAAAGILADLQQQDPPRAPGTLARLLRPLLQRSLPAGWRYAEPPTR